MWRLTPEKVIDRVNAIIDELGTYEIRIRAYEDQSRFIRESMTEISGSPHELVEWRMAHDDIYELLVDARAELQSGLADHKVISKQLPAIRKAVRNFKRVLDQTDAAAAQGRAAAQRVLGTNAKNY